MAAPVIRFATAIAACEIGGGVAIALIADAPAAAPESCVAILLCSAESAAALAETVGSAVKSFDR